MSIGKYRHIYDEFMRTQPRFVHMIYAMLDKDKSPDDVYEYMKTVNEALAIDGYLIAKYISAASVEP